MGKITHFLKKTYIFALLNVKFIYMRSTNHISNFRFSKFSVLFTMLLISLFASAETNILTNDSVVATGQARYCLTYNDYLADRWTDAGEVEMHKIFPDKSFLGSDNDGFSFVSIDEKISKILKKKALFVLYGDSLYVNCRQLKSDDFRSQSVFVCAYKYNGTQICFTACPSKEGGIAAATFMFGVIGGLAYAANQKNKHFEYCYIFSGNNLYPKRVTIDYIEQIFNAFDEQQELRDRWNMIKKDRDKTSAPVVLYIFQQLGLLDEYKPIEQ